MQNVDYLRAYEGDQPFIFLSYSHKDKEEVYPLINSLQKKYNLWFDAGIHYGHEWEEEIWDRLQKCSVFLFIVTTNSLYSDNCKDELHFAREQKKHFVNLMFDRQVELPGWFVLRYARYQMCYLDTFLTYEDAAEDLERKCEWLRDTRKTFKEEIDLFITQESSITKTLVLEIGSNKTVVSLNDIVIIERVNDTSVISFTNGSYLESNKTLEEFHHEICDTRFVQVHKDFIVNMQHITSVDNNSIICLSNGLKADLSLEKRIDFFQRYEHFIKIS